MFTRKMQREFAAISSNEADGEEHAAPMIQ